MCMFRYDWPNKMARVDLVSSEWDPYCRPEYNASATPCAHMYSDDKMWELHSVHLEFRSNLTSIKLMMMFVLVSRTSSLLANYLRFYFDVWVYYKKAQASFLSSIPSMLKLCLFTFLLSIWKLTTPHVVHKINILCLSGLQLDVMAVRRICSCIQS